MAPNFELCILSLPQFYRKSHDTFHSLTQDSSCVFSALSAQFGMTFAFFFILNSKKQTEQRFYGSFGEQGFRLELNVSKGIREH